MNTWTRIGIGLGVVVAGLGGVLAMTNPNPTAYETFATNKLADYLSTKLCGNEAKKLGLQQDCEDTLRSGRVPLRRFITRQTDRQNFLFFSIYTTQLEISPLLPSYRFETVGGLGQFYVYKSERQ
jgi:hypothetical protein